MERHLPLSNSTLYQQLKGFRIELALYMMAATKSENVKKSISNYFTRLRHTQPSVTGKDLIKMGLEPGPNFKEILQAVLDAKLNGRLKTRNDELGFVKDYVQ